MDDIVLLVYPQGLEHVVLIVRVLLVKLRHPCVDGVDHFAGWSRAQFGSRVVASAVFWLFEQVEDFAGRLASDGSWFQQWPAVVCHAVDTAMFTVAIWIAQIVLHVADDWIVPISEVDGTVGADFDVRRP